MIIILNNNYIYGHKFALGFEKAVSETRGQFFFHMEKKIDYHTGKKNNEH